MELTREEQAWLDGRAGEATRLALALVVRMGELFGAERLLPVAQAHIDACLYTNDAGLEFAERLAALGARVRVPTTLNVTARDIRRWEAFRVPADWAEKSRRLEAAYQALGCLPTWTCAPYEQGMVPRFGQQVAWGESNAVAYVNTVIGARTNRYADFLDVACALTGRAPAFGLHLDGPRRGQVLVDLAGLPASLRAHPSLYPVLGYHVGAVAGERVPVLDGVPRAVRAVDLKAFCAAAASSGALALAHVVGVTPEAPTREVAFQGAPPEEAVTVELADLRAARARLSPAPAEGVDFVKLGCPHLALAEALDVAERVAGRRVRAGLEFWVSTSRAVAHHLAESGHLVALEGAGVRLLTDTCAMTTRIDGWGFTHMLTNSGKQAHYASAGGLEVTLASLEDCVAVALGDGAAEDEEALWSA
jgi:cis-L-3-hydroxyproline dehydratase